MNAQRLVDQSCEVQGQSSLSGGLIRCQRGVSGVGSEWLVRVDAQSGWSPDHARGQRGLSGVLANLEKFYVGVCVGAGSVLGGPGLAQVRS